MKIAIINCKRQKQTYSCSADEMYSKAFTYMAQRNFIKLAYDDYYIFSSKYGIIHHTTIIEPYDITLENTIMKYNIIRTSTEANINQLNANIKQFIETNINNQLDFHITLGYWDYIKQFKSNNIRHIMQQKNTGMIKERYCEAATKWNGNIDNSIIILQTPIPANPELSHIWTHDVFGEWEGKSYYLWKDFKDKQPKLDQAVLRKVGFGISPQHKGWKLKSGL